MNLRRVGFHYHVPGKQVAGKIFLPGYLGRFVDSLAEEFRQVVCFLHSPVESELATLDYPLEHKNINLVDIGKHESIPRRMAQAGKITKILQAHKAEIDVMLVRAPTPLVGVVDRALKDVPLALLVVGDYVAGLKSLPQPWWRKQLIAGWSHWNKHEQMVAAQRGLVFVNNRMLFQEFQHRIKDLKEIRTTNLTSSDFFEREDTCLRKPVQILYTGRLDRSKGILDILDAVAMLIASGEDVVFNLVGWTYRGDNTQDELLFKAKKLGIEDRVIYHGYKTIGEELFSYYKTCDIFITASQAAEGFPRTIWEAMAHSLPVVATRVGSIPDYIEGAAELVEPRSPQAIFQALRTIIVDRDKRKEYIQAGREISRQNTLEGKTSEMVEAIETWLATRS